MNDHDIIARWRDQPFPLLPCLHAFHDRDGYLSDDAIRAVAAGLKIPEADLYGTVTFYHHFSRTPPGKSGLRVCDGPICRQRGSQELIAALGPEATPMACAGRCDDPIPVLQGDRTLLGTKADSLAPRPSPLPAANPGGHEECALRHIREPGRATLDGYRRTGGYAALERAVREGSPEAVIESVTESKLAGRGGAGFPTGVKWRAVRDAEGDPKYIVCNADEGEPGCFKDRLLMEHDPHAVVEGMILAGYAAGARSGFIYLRYEYPETEGILERAIAEANGAGLLGDGIFGSDFGFDLYVRRGAGAYICGEETSLLNSLEGKHPFPRNKPPYPVTHGLDDKPTVINNVETLVAVPQILIHGADWYRGLGMGEHAGTKIVSVSGDVMRPGNYEVPFGLPLKTLLVDWCGGAPNDRSIRAVTMAGLSGGFLGPTELDVTLDEPSIRSKGSFLGAAGIMVFDDSRNVVQIAREAMEFFAHESCGKCFPCRIGTQRLTERLAGIAGPDQLPAFVDELRDIGDVMKSASACGLGMAAPLVTESLLRNFMPDVEQHVAASLGSSNGTANGHQSS